jgi:hypothetical protein
MARERDRADEDQRRERGPEDSARARPDAVEEGLDADVPHLLEAERGAEEDRPDEAVGRELLDPDERLAEGITGHDLHRDRDHHERDEEHARGALHLAEPRERTPPDRESPVHSILRRERRGAVSAARHHLTAWILA